MYIFKTNDGNFIHSIIEKLELIKELTGSIVISKQEFYNPENYTLKPVADGCVVFEEKDVPFVLELSIVKFKQFGQFIAVSKISDN